MILALHIMIALAGLLSATCAFFFPAKTWIRLSSALTFLTLASGTWLVYTSKSALLQPCISGLVYLGVVFFAIASAKRKLERI